MCCKATASPLGERCVFAKSFTNGIALVERVETIANLELRVAGDDLDTLAGDRTRSTRFSNHRQAYTCGASTAMPRRLRYFSAKSRP